MKWITKTKWNCIIYGCNLSCDQSITVWILEYIKKDDVKGLKNTTAVVGNDTLLVFSDTPENDMRIAKDNRYQTTHKRAKDKRCNYTEARNVGSL